MERNPRLNKENVMALVKITVKCPHCKVDHEEYDPSQYDDREKYLAYWNLPFEGEEADKAWEEKKNMTPREAPRVMSDIGGYVSQVTGEYIDSRSKHRNHLKQHGMVELGNDLPKQQKSVEIDRKSQEQRKRTIAEVANARLR
jgi:protein-disulfide isomerase